jgi:hypothetical protein
VNEPFVGRQDELDRLAELQRRAHRARLPAASLITGEPGAGKSRLLARALELSKMPQARLAGFEPLQSVPLAAAAALLRLLTEVPGAGRDLDQLVFGELAQESRDPLRIFEGAHRALGSSRPMLIAIDDLQWVDDLSIGLIHYLLQAAEAGGRELVVLAAARPSRTAGTFAAALDASVPADLAGTAVIALTLSGFAGTAAAANGPTEVGSCNMIHALFVGANDGLFGAWVVENANGLDGKWVAVAASGCPFEKFLQP